MQYDISDMERDVRTALDENRRSESLVADGDVDTLSLNDVIGQKIEDAVKAVEMSAPVELLDGVPFNDVAATVTDDMNGYVTLPTDFMRLVAFRMSDWQCPVFAAMEPTDDAYIFQKSKWGIRGNWERPVCAIVPTANGRVLEFYCCRSKSATVATALYLPYPKVENGKVGISQRLYRAAVYMTAALVLMTYGDEANAKLLVEQSNNAKK